MFSAGNYAKSGRCCWLTRRMCTLHRTVGSYQDSELLRKLLKSLAMAENRTGNDQDRDELQDCVTGENSPTW